MLLVQINSEDAERSELPFWPVNSFFDVDVGTEAATI